MLIIGKKKREKIRKALVRMYEACHHIEDPEIFAKAVDGVATVGVELNFRWEDVLSAKDISAWEEKKNVAQ